MLRQLSRERMIIRDYPEAWTLRILQMTGGTHENHRDRSSVVLCVRSGQSGGIFSGSWLRIAGREIRSEVDESQHPVPSPEEGKALIYFVADGHLTSIFGVDGKWAGAVNGGRYFFVPVDPGEHHLWRCCSLFFHSEVLEFR